MCTSSKKREKAEQAGETDSPGRPFAIAESLAAASLLPARKEMSTLVSEAMLACNQPWAGEVLLSSLHIPGWVGAVGAAGARREGGRLVCMVVDLYVAVP